MLQFEWSLGSDKTSWFVMEIVDDSLREAMTENMCVSPQSVDFLQMLEHTLALAHLAVTYNFDPATLEGRSFGGLRELRSPLSDY
jgi:hypothetical protein